MADMTQGDMLELLADLVAHQEAKGDGDPGVTTEELAEALGFLNGLPHSCMRRLRQAIKDEKVVVGRGLRVNIAGVPYRPPVYRLATSEERRPVVGS